jgi:glycine cleavage system H protein
MPKPLVFMMGRSPVFLPVDRRYAPNHMWAQAAEGGFRIGLTAYAVKLLGDLKHLEWSVAGGDNLTQGRPIGTVEGSKATSELYAPFDGRVVQINAEVAGDPSRLNANPYEDAWLLTVVGWGEILVSAQQYLAQLEKAWPLAQRLLKGQAGGA